MKPHYVLPRLVYRSVIALNTIALSAPSFALGLPTLENPSRGTGSGIMETIRNYGYDIVPLASLLSTVALVPTCIVAAIALGGFVGGGILRRQKRGRPDTWLYRHLQWWLASRYPLLAGWVGGHTLITRSGAWSVRREAR